MVYGKVFSHNKLPQWEEPFECCLFGLCWRLSAHLISAFPLQVVTITADNINIPLISYDVFNPDYNLVFR